MQQNPTPVTGCTNHPVKLTVLTIQVNNSLILPLGKTKRYDDWVRCNRGLTSTNLAISY